MSDEREERIRKILVGESRAIREVRREISRFAGTNLPILIQGPTGSGKELVAQCIHLFSRRNGDFVSFNVCAVSDGMFEDALFGHVRGAFTGATGDSLGYLAEANGGSVLLDEISGLSMQSQGKLLRALETGVFRPVGASRDRQSDFRLIAASNEDLDHLAGQQRFRSDLLYRIGGHIIHVPGLAERPEDVPLLAQHFLRLAGGGGAVSDDVGAMLMRHPWRGNIRELRHAVSRAVVLADGGPISCDAMHSALGRTSTRRRDEVGSADGLSVMALACVLERHGGDTRRAADELEIHRATLYRWIKRSGLTGSLSGRAREAAAEATRRDGPTLGPMR